LKRKEREFRKKVKESLERKGVQKEGVQRREGGM
jgi:hypothetical protein